MTDRRPDLHRAGAMVATGLAALPVAVAGVRAAAGDWVPQGDNAYFTVRSLDVATEHHPLLGAWSSGSADVERSVNNLGPVQLDLLAPFTRIAPMGGTAVAVAVIQIAAIVTVAWLVRRIAGWRGVPPAMVAVSTLTWVLGSEMLITPRQHQFLLVPYLVVLVAAWAAAAGDRWAIVAFVVAGSLVTQTHLSYPILVGALAVPVFVGQVLAARRSGDARSFRRPWAVAAITGVVLWSQTAYDQFFGRGNLGDVVRSPGESESPTLSTGLRIAADVLVDTGAFLRPGFGDFDPNAGVADDWQVAVLVLGCVVLAAGAVVAARRRRPTVAAGLTVGLVAVTAAVADATQLPVTQFGLTAGNYRWLWPTAAFLAMGALLALERASRAVVPALAATAACLAVVALVAVLNLPESFQVPDPDRYRADLAATAEITGELAEADLSAIDGPVRIDQSQMYFGHPFTYPIAVVLVDRDLEFRLDGAEQARRFGDDRVSDGSEPFRLVLVHADAARAVEGDPRVVAFADGADPVALVLERTG